MQINVALRSDNQQQADILRSSLFPSTTRQEIKDSFVFARCIELFDGEPKELLPFFEEDVPLVSRMLSIRADIHQRLKDISATLGKSQAATYRMIICHRIAQLHRDDANDGNTVPRPLEAGVDRRLMDKLLLLQTQVQTVSGTLCEIIELLNKEEK